jgi:hypothetical protein
MQANRAGGSIANRFAAASRISFDKCKTESRFNLTGVMVMRSAGDWFQR